MIRTSTWSSQHEGEDVYGDAEGVEQEGNWRGNLYLVPIQQISDELATWLEANDHSFYKETK